MTTKNPDTRARRSGGAAAGDPRSVRVPARPGDSQVRVRLLGLGSMAVGSIEAIGMNAVGFARGDRVVFPISRRERTDIDTAADFGTPTETLVVSADALIGVPRDVSDERAARLVAPGLVARVLLKQLTPVRTGDRVRLAMEPGIGRGVIAAWARFLGATVLPDAAAAAAQGPADETPDVTLDDDAVRTAQAIAFRRGHLQVGSAEVFAVIRQGGLDAALSDRDADTRAAA
jgi:hypothetical protein